MSKVQVSLDRDQAEALGVFLDENDLFPEVCDALLEVVVRPVMAPGQHSGAVSVLKGVAGDTYRVAGGTSTINQYMAQRGPSLEVGVRWWRLDPNGRSSHAPMSYWNSYEHRTTNDTDNYDGYWQPATGRWAATPEDM